MKQCLTGFNFWFLVYFVFCSNLVKAEVAASHASRLLSEASHSPQSVSTLNRLLGLQHFDQLPASLRLRISNNQKEAEEQFELSALDDQKNALIFYRLADQEKLASETMEFVIRRSDLRVHRQLFGRCDEQNLTKAGVTKCHLDDHLQFMAVQFEPDVVFSTKDIAVYAEAKEIPLCELAKAGISQGVMVLMLLRPDADISLLKMGCENKAVEWFPNIQQEGWSYYPDTSEAIFFVPGENLITIKEFNHRSYSLFGFLSMAEHEEGAAQTDGIYNEVASPVIGNNDPDTLKK